jgi:hypothetical protein
MESDDLKSNPSDDAALDAWLRSAGSLPPLRDDGFSQRVLATLPAVARPAAQRVWVCATGAAAGLAMVAFAMFESGAGFWNELPAFETNSQDWLPAVAIPLALGLAVLSVWMAFRRQWRTLLRL